MCDCNYESGTLVDSSVYEDTNSMAFWENGAKIDLLTTLHPILVRSLKLPLENGSIVRTRGMTITIMYPDLDLPPRKRYRKMILDILKNLQLDDVSVDTNYCMELLAYKVVAYLPLKIYKLPKGNNYD